jgi:hypothetical protein
VYMQCEVQIPLSIQINKSHVRLIVRYPPATVRDTITITREVACKILAQVVNYGCQSVGVESRSK